MKKYPPEKNSEKSLLKGPLKGRARLKDDSAMVRGWGNPLRYIRPDQQGLSNLHLKLLSIDAATRREGSQKNALACFDPSDFVLGRRAAKAVLV